MKNQFLASIYTAAVQLLGNSLKFLSLFHSKAKKWTVGRKNWDNELITALQDHRERPLIWFHCASLGEFEQGRNLIDAIKIQNSSLFILITFFSPSGYEVRKNYKMADFVAYLPLDTPDNAQQLLSIIKPTFVCFVRYDLWLNILAAIREKGIPIILISARMDQSSAFLSSVLSPLYIEALNGLTAIFTQNHSTAAILSKHCNKVEIIESSDTRYDRVSSNRIQFQSMGNIAEFKRNRLCLIAGSSWPKGEQMLLRAFEELSNSYNYCMIIAPHEIDDKRISKWEKKYPDLSIRYSRIEQLNDKHRILWIDNIGMLSRLYYYADVSYIGGAWGKGLHNILEPTVFGVPVILGPNYQKFPEAIDLLNAGGAFSVSNYQEFLKTLDHLLGDPTLRNAVKRTNIAFIQSRTGATEQILSWCNELDIFSEV